MPTDSERLVALEAWVDRVTPTLRSLARRAAPHFDASGTAQAINYAVPEGSEREDVRAAVPTRATS